nr:glycosyltransferase [Allomuricauda sp.]
MERVDGEPDLTNRDVSEDHDLRSKYIQGLIKSDCIINHQSGAPLIPKTIIQYWHDLDRLPTDVERCLASWQPLLEKGFKRLIFDDKGANEFIRNEFGELHQSAYFKCHHPAMRCDFFRLCYMVRYGGFYLDADEVYLDKDVDGLFQDNRVKIQPLCYDIATDSMIKAETFTKKGINSPSWIFYVNNNPIISPARHPLISLALERAMNILLNSKTAFLDIQSTTGPGNISASLVKHSINLKSLGSEADFKFVNNWDSISESKWPLSYRTDVRNWRIWNPSKSLDEPFF